MKKIWSIVLTAAAAVLALGVVCLLVGVFTGGSLDRMLGAVGGREGLDLIFEIIKTEFSNIF